MRTRRTATDLGALLLVGAALFGSLFPIYWTVTTALKTQRATFATPPQLVPEQPTLDNFAAVLARGDFTSSVTSSLVIALGATVLCVIVGGLAAYALVRTRFRGARLLAASVLALRILPAIAIVLPLYRIFAVLGILDNRLAMIVVYAALNLPFAIWLLASYLGQVPIDLEDAAQVDGATRLQVLRMVVLPISLPGVIATALFVAILCWNEFLIPVILTTTDAKPLSVFIASFVGSRTTAWGELAAAATLAILPIVIVAFLVQRYVLAGLTMGAVKE
jgi:multiple sugar transport system permease protein